MSLGVDNEALRTRGQEEASHVTAELLSVAQVQEWGGGGRENPGVTAGKRTEPEGAYAETP